MDHIRRLAERIAESTGDESRAVEMSMGENTGGATTDARPESTLDGLTDLVCVQHRPSERPFVADGTHRAVAAVAALVAGERETAPRIGAYVGVGSNRPFEDVTGAFKAVRRAVRRRLFGKSEPNGF